MEDTLRQSLEDSTKKEKEAHEMMKILNHCHDKKTAFMEKIQVNNEDNFGDILGKDTISPHQRLK